MESSSESEHDEDVNATRIGSTDGNSNWTKY